MGSYIKKKTMRYLMIIISIIIGITVKGQCSDLFECGFKGNIKRIIEKSEKFPDSWREYNFDNHYRLKEKKYYRDYKLVLTETTSYFRNDSLLTTRKVINGEIYIDKYYFNSDKKLKRHEIFSPKDTISPMTILTDFVYLGNELKQFKHISTRNSDTTETKYKKSNLTARITHTNKKEKNRYIQTLKYDKKGNLISETIDYNNPEIVLAGVRTWSRFKHDKYRIDYKLDDYGNWISRYSVTWLKKRKIEERQIEYK